MSEYSVAIVFDETSLRVCEAVSEYLLLTFQLPGSPGNTWLAKFYLSRN